MKFLSRLILATCMCWLASNGSFLSAQEGKPTRIALTEAPQDDAEFDLLGEYVGPITIGENQYEPLGLQVRPIGNDSFEALQYKGGLPGQETFANEEPVKLVGRRSGDFIVLSGGPWAVFVDHDDCLIIDRDGKKIGTLQRIVRGSPTMGAVPPAEATILFDGSSTDQFTTARKTPEGLLMEGADVRPMFQDFDLHVEFRLPYMPTSDGQQRGNSGCYLQSRYEVQVLDSFAQVPVFNGCSSIYRFKAPDLNMCLPPLQWQTYDIRFTAARWAADGTKIRNARITVWQNGVKTQDDVELKNKTGAGKEEAPSLLPIRFQNHSDPVRFRNIWIVDRGLAHVDFPVMSPTVPTEQPAEGTSTAVKPDASVTAKTEQAIATTKAVAQKAPAAKDASAQVIVQAKPVKSVQSEVVKAAPAQDVATKSPGKESGAKNAPTKGKN